MGNLIFSLVFFLLYTFSFLLQSSSAAFNVNRFGAKPDGKTDSTQPFLKAWASACSSARPAVIYVPKGRYLLKAVVFRGPCKNRITVQIDGTIIAPTDFLALGKSGYWILFVQVDRVSVFGGTLDAKGAGFWTCRRSGKHCPNGARSITFNWANNIVISGLRSINSQLSHIVINSCNNIMLKNVKLFGPDQSPNT
ncbi:hypothetical protein SLA2020_455200 [Shorea laevis]